MTDAKTQIQETITAHNVVLFMKGNKTMPQCGFSSRVAGVLNYMNVDYTDVNVLADEGLRQGIKEFSDWPTIPQLYVKGEFVGGCDIITEMTRMLPTRSAKPTAKQSDQITGLTKNGCAFQQGAPDICFETAALSPDAHVIACDTPHRLSCLDPPLSHARSALQRSPCSTKHSQNRPRAIHTARPKLHAIVPV